MVCQCFASILTRLQLDSPQSDAAIASLACHGSGGSIPRFGSLERFRMGEKSGIRVRHSVEAAMKSERG